MGKTFAEKILARKAGLGNAVVGQIVEPPADVALSHDNTAPISEIFRQMGGVKVFDPAAHVIVLDHAAPAPTTKHAENHRIIRQFVREQGIENFFDVGRGVCHQVLVEEGFALPGEIVLGSDSHTPHAGVMGAFAAGIGRTEMASLWALGRLYLFVPPSLKITVHGQLDSGITAKDLALSIIARLGNDGGLGMSVEWHGDGIAALSLAERAVLTNMMAEMGCKNSYIPPDQITFDYLKDRARRDFEPIYPDPDAEYALQVEINANEIDPMVACPHRVDNAVPISQVAGVHIDQAFIGACTNGRIEDLAMAAQVLKGQHIASGTRMIVIPASSQVYLEALARGYLQTFIEAGAVVESPGCGPCMGNHLGVPAIGEVTISTANRNFKGRMGTTESSIYLGSPAVVAASAVAGKITHPREL